MRCYYPFSAWRSREGGLVFTKDKAATASNYLLPCGRCLACRLNRQREWMIRLYHENHMHQTGIFLNLTFDEENMPYPPSIDVSHTQRFLKRVRKMLAKQNLKVRYFAIHEYGGQNGRFHIHILLWGWWPEDSYKSEQSKKGHWLYVSPTLNKLWPYGLVNFGLIERNSIQYCARYTVDKITGDLAEDHYQFVDPRTQEVHQLAPEKATMSLKPAIGESFFHKYTGDIFPGDFVLVDGKQLPVPGFYDNLCQKHYPDLWQEVTKRREQRRKETGDPYTIAYHTDHGTETFPNREALDALRANTVGRLEIFDQAPRHKQTLGQKVAATFIGRDTDDLVVGHESTI